MTDLNTRATSAHLPRLAPRLLLVVLLVSAAVWVFALQVDAQITSPEPSVVTAITERGLGDTVSPTGLVQAKEVSAPSPRDTTGSSASGAPAAWTYTTTAVITGSEGQAGWYVSAVTVTLAIEGDASGGAQTFWRLDSQDWLTYTTPFTIQSDGVHQLDFYSDVTSSPTEPTHTVQISVDVTPPSSAVSFLPAYQSSTSFPVAWSADDNGGSGVVTFDVQQKDGFAGTWQDWLTNTTALSEKFSTGQRGHVYYFQARAHDVAGNVEQYPGGRGDASTFVDSVINGGFESGDFSGWSVGGVLSKSITNSNWLWVGGSGQWTALLGSPDYGPSITPTEELHVPVGTASISQAIVVPSLDDMPAPALTLWYHIYTYDVVWGCGDDSAHNLYDSLDVTVRDRSGNILGLPVRDGNYDCETYLAYLNAHDNRVPPLTEIVRQRLPIDLRPYAGQTVTIELDNANRIEPYYNTFTYVDDLHVINELAYGYRLDLPIIISGTSQSAAPGIQQRPALPTPRR